MTLDIAALNQAAAAAPQHAVPVITQGRVLLVDGDALCYYCAGNDETSPGEARLKVLSFLRQALTKAGCATARLLVTGDGSHKGHRYAVARVKPYQGQRANSRRPQNWAHLRHLVQSGAFDNHQISTTVTTDAEADDLFHAISHEHPEDFVIFTEDKDMRMCAGWHLTWPDMLLHYVEPGTFNLQMHAKTYGYKWFWWQMLRGDYADNIPGLPGYYDGTVVKSGVNKGQVKVVQVGDKFADAALLGTVDNDRACLLVAAYYKNFYGTLWRAQMLEQGILLWMRKNPADVFDVLAPGNPMHGLFTSTEEAALKEEFNERIAQAQDDRGQADPGEDALAAGLPVCDLQAPVQDRGGSAGPRPLDGGSPSSAAPGVQRPPWED